MKLHLPKTLPQYVLLIFSFLACIMNIIGIVFLVQHQQVTRALAKRNELSCLTSNDDVKRTDLNKARSSAQILRELDQTQENLKELLNRYKRESGVKDNSLKQQIRETASTRKQGLLAIMRQDPNQALQQIEGNPQLERDIRILTYDCEIAQDTVEGTLEIMHVDYSDSNDDKPKKNKNNQRLRIAFTKSKNYYSLKEKGNKKRINLHFTGSSPQNLRFGTQIKITGYRLDNDLLINSKEKNNIASVDTVAAQSKPESFGEQKTAVILANFAGFAEPKLTKEQVQETLFTEINKFYNEVSFGAASLTGQIYGWYTIDAPNTCEEDFLDLKEGIGNLPTSTQTILDAADPDINYAEVKRVIIIAPFGDDCAWGGIGSFGTISNQTLEGKVDFSLAHLKIYDQNTLLGALTHELGHNFGVDHAGLLNCGDNAICNYNSDAYQEYGNPHNAMGSGYGHFSAMQKVFIGWIPAENAIVVQKSGTWNIYPVEQKTDQIQLLTLPRIIPYFYQGDYMYVEYRKRIGYDAQFSYFEWNKGATLEVATIINKPILFDPTPPTDQYNSVLLKGESFIDPLTGTVIKVLDQTEEYITVEVDYKGPVIPTDFLPPGIISHGEKSKAR